MQLTTQLQVIAKKMGMHFTFKGRVLPPADVFGERGLLPGLVKRADQLASLCLGYGLGATYEEDETALLGSRIVLDEYTPNALRLLCIVDTLYEIAKGSTSYSAVSLDELMYD